jgi:hypothetical protein
MYKESKIRPKIICNKSRWKSINNFEVLLNVHGVKKGLANWEDRCRKALRFLSLNGPQIQRGAYEYFLL